MKLQEANVPRPLTPEESETLMRQLIVALGPATANHALRVIAEFGAGVFMPGVES